MLRRTAFALLVFLLAGAGAGSGGAAAVFNPETFTLGNGMQVVVVENHRVPVVIHMLWYRVGSADEPPGKGGIAHFLEHLMFKGTETLGPGEFSRIVSRNGGSENAFTSDDYTGFYQIVAKDRLEKMMAMEADRMTHLVLTANEVEPERKVILEERRARVGNQPAAVLGEHVDAALFLNHPYRRPIIGWEHEIRALSIADILDFYKRWYAPNNAILVVGGDITAAELKPLAERTYGTLSPAPEPPPRFRPDEPPQSAARRVELRDPKVRQPVWERVHLAPSHLSGERRHVPALEVLAELLGGSDTSRLYQALVVGGGKAVTISCDYDPDAMGPAKFTLHASPSRGVSMATLESVVLAEIGRVLKEGVMPDEVERAKKRLRAGAVFARDALRTGAEVLGQALAMGRAIADVEAWPDTIAAVTKADVDAAARAVLRPESSVTALLLPEGGGQ